MAAGNAPVSWAEFARREPDLAAAGQRLLCPVGEVAVGFLGTVSAAGMPHLAPVCPIACDEWLYLSVAARSPKRRDLDATGRYVLHALLGPGDAEFQFSGQVEHMVADAERRRVHAAIRFAAFQPADPIYRLWIEQALLGRWENPGKPGTRPVRRRFRA